LSRRYVCPLAPAREARPIHEGWPKPFGPDSRLTVASFQPRRTKDNVILVAAVKNEGTDIWADVFVEAHLLDAQHQVVAVCGGSAPGPTRPGAQRFAPLHCQGSAQQPVPDHTAYEVGVSNARVEPGESH